MKKVANEKAENLLKAVSVVWRDNEGPFENLFRLISYSPVLFAGLGGLALTGIDKIVSYMWKMGLEDFGAWIDKQLGKGPRSDVSQRDFDSLRDLLTQQLEANAKVNNGQMVKVAGLGGIFRLFGGTGKIVNMILSFVMRAFAFVAMALGAASTGDIYDKVKGIAKEQVKKQVKEVGQEAVQEMFQGQNMGDLTELLGYLDKKRS